MSAAVSLLLSQVRDSTVGTMLEYRTRCDKSHVLKVHGELRVRDLVVAGWSDASPLNRPDGKSTQGISYRNHPPKSFVWRDVQSKSSVLALGQN